MSVRIMPKFGCFPELRLCIIWYRPGRGKATTCQSTQMALCAIVMNQRHYDGFADGQCEHEFPYVSERNKRRSQQSSHWLLPKAPNTRCGTKSQAVPFEWSKTSVLCHADLRIAHKSLTATSGWLPDWHRNRSWSRVEIPITNICSRQSQNYKMPQTRKVSAEGSYSSPGNGVV